MDDDLTQINQLHRDFMQVCEEFQEIFSGSSSMTSDAEWLMDRFSATISLGRNIRTNESFIAITDEIQKQIEKANELFKTTRNMAQKENIRGHEDTIKSNLKEIMDIYNHINDRLKAFINFYNKEVRGLKDYEEGVKGMENWFHIIRSHLGELHEKVDALKAKSIELTDHAKSLYYIKEKLKIEKDKSKELGKVDIIQAWPIPTSYKFFVLFGLGLISSSTIVNAIGLSTGIGIVFPPLGIFLLIIGLYFWNKHDKAKLLAYSRETSINAEDLLSEAAITAIPKKKK